MRIQTTINISMEKLDKLIIAAERLKTSRTAIISSLLNHHSRINRRSLEMWKSVKYQERMDKSKWRRCHISVRADEYEFFIDLRKVMKMSVSFLIAYAIDEYLDELFSPTDKSVDNYPYCNYMISKFEVGNVICCVFCWGIPPNPHRISA